MVLFLVFGHVINSLLQEMYLAEFTVGTIKPKDIQEWHYTIMEHSSFKASG